MNDKITNNEKRVKRVFLIALLTLTAMTGASKTSESSPAEKEDDIVCAFFTGGGGIFIIGKVLEVQAEVGNTGRNPAINHQKRGLRIIFQIIQILSGILMFNCTIVGIQKF